MYQSIEVILINAMTRHGSEPGLVTRCVESDNPDENIFHPNNALRTAYIDCTVSVDPRIDITDIYITGHMPFVKEVKKTIMEYKNVKGNALSCKVFQWGTVLSKYLGAIYAHHLAVNPDTCGDIYLRTEECDLYQLVYLGKTGFGLKLEEAPIVPHDDLPKLVNIDSPDFYKSVVSNCQARKAAEVFWENHEYMDSAQIAMRYGDKTKAEYALLPAHFRDKIIELFNNAPLSR